MMRKFLLMALFAITSSLAFGQEVGGQIVYGTDLDQLGLGIKSRTMLEKQFRGAASFDYLFANSERWAWNINTDVHYLFPQSSKFTFYPLAGLTFYHTVNYSKLGINLGGGVDYSINKNMKLNFEPKFQLIGHYNQVVLSFGVLFKI